MQVTKSLMLLCQICRMTLKQRLIRLSQRRSRQGWRCRSKMRAWLRRMQF